ncbi:MAG: hypothetical protein U0Q18_00810 [Bryobacteraceae bacterium]
MKALQLAAAGLLSTAIQAGDNPVAGKWSCTNIPVNGPEAPWTLIVRDQGAQLSGILTDGEAEVALSGMKITGKAFTFRFFINGKPYGFEGTLDNEKLVGKYSGQEASGRLKCSRPVQE